MLARLKKDKMSEVSGGILKGPFAVRLLDGLIESSLIGAASILKAINQSPSITKEPLLFKGLDG